MTKEYQKWLIMEEISWRQKSRISWSKDGNKNTSFFHKIVGMNVKNNFMDRLLIDDSWVMGPKEIEDRVVEFYILLYSEPFECRPTLEGLQFKRLSVDQRDNLEKYFSEEEVV